MVNFKTGKGYEKHTIPLFHSQKISALPSRNCAIIKVVYSLCFSLQNSWAKINACSNSV